MKKLEVEVRYAISKADYQILLKSLNLGGNVVFTSDEVYCSLDDAPPYYRIRYSTNQATVYDIKTPQGSNFTEEELSFSSEIEARKHFQAKGLTNSLNISKFRAIFKKENVPFVLVLDYVLELGGFFVEIESLNGEQASIEEGKYLIASYGVLLPNHSSPAYGTIIKSIKR